MRKFVLTLLLLGLLAGMLAACGSSQPADPAAAAVTAYINALVGKDSTKLSALSCATWEPQALMELDSFQAVKTRLDSLSCKTSTTANGTTANGTTQVNCQGRILATYNGEDQPLDLSTRTYQVVQQGGNYLVCGYK